ncbi:MAG TPA: hypothetical protein PKZ99_03240, partial [Azospirillaceae bacterium]|nr:hypothetical protein [Azospirillaceae bacterium]
MRILLYTAYPWHLPSGQVAVWRWATAPGYQSWPSDNPSSETWLPCVERPADLVLSIPAPGESGRGSAAEGRLVLANPLDRQTGRGARPLNALVTEHVTQGRRILVQEIRPDQPLSSAVTIFDGVMGAAEIERGRVMLTIRDRSDDFDAALLTETYSGAGGLNGPAPLKDKTRERCFGYVQYCEPTYLGVIDGLHVYSMNGGHPIDAVEAFGDAGRPRPYVAGTPTGEQWTYDAATGLIRCGGASAPEAPWARVRGDRTGNYYRSNIGALAAFWVGGLTGKRTAGEIDWDSVGVLDATPRPIGLYIPAGAGVTIRDALDRALGSIWGGYWTHGAPGKFRVGRVPTTAAAPMARYRAGANCGPIKPASGAPAAAAKKVTWRFAPNFAPIDQPTPAATVDEAARAKTDYLEESTPENTAVATAWGGAAREVTVDSLLALRAD